jgi:ArsR family transcriptional regulator
MEAVNRSGVVLDRTTAQEYARWFRSLADATRIQILHVLATSQRPMKVGEVTACVGVAQSTVSVHLNRLAEVGFVLVERVGQASWYRFNPECLQAFPSAADVVVGGDS